MSNHALDYSVSREELELGDCYADRRTTRIMEQKEGEVVLLDPVNFGIHCSDACPILMPCNLPEAYQQTGLKILFGGMVKEMLPNEILTAPPFVITSLQRSS